MKTFTATQLRRDSSPVYNAVQAYRAVSISNSMRPEMVLITKEYLYQLIDSETQRAMFLESGQAGDDIDRMLENMENIRNSRLGK